MQNEKLFDIQACLKDIEQSIAEIFLIFCQNVIFRISV
jgi:hypothetical protein